MSQAQQKIFEIQILINVIGPARRRQSFEVFIDTLGCKVTSARETTKGNKFPTPFFQIDYFTVSPLL